MFIGKDQFINDYSPSTSWEEIVNHPNQDQNEYKLEMGQSANAGKRWDEKYPSDLSSSEVDDILRNLNSHRSNFVHRGEQPPHRFPYSVSRFIQEHSYSGRNDLAVRESHVQGIPQIISKRIDKVPCNFTIVVN